MKRCLGGKRDLKRDILFVWAGGVHILAAYMEARGQFRGAISLLPLCMSHGSKLGASGLTASVLHTEPLLAKICASIDLLGVSVCACHAACASGFFLSTMLVLKAGGRHLYLLSRLLSQFSDNVKGQGP